MDNLYIGTQPYKLLDNQDQDFYFPSGMTITDDDEEIFITVESSEKETTKEVMRDLLKLLNSLKKEAEDKEPKRWARKHSRCVSCHTQNTPHVAKGMCVSCYHINRLADKMDYANFEKYPEVD